MWCLAWPGTRKDAVRFRASRRFVIHAPLAQCQSNRLLTCEVGVQIPGGAPLLYALVAEQVYAYGPDPYAREGVRVRLSPSALKLVELGIKSRTRHQSGVVQRQDAALLRQLSWFESTHRSTCSCGETEIIPDYESGGGGSIPHGSAIMIGRESGRW
jgi:hypothetical protein